MIDIPQREKVRLLSLYWVQSVFTFQEWWIDPIVVTIDSIGMHWFDYKYSEFHQCVSCMPIDL